MNSSRLLPSNTVIPTPVMPALTSCRGMKSVDASNQLGLVRINAPIIKVRLSIKFKLGAEDVIVN